MSFAVALRCLRCQRSYPLSHHDRDCPACHDEHPSGLAVVYDAAMLAPRARAPAGRGLWRYGDLLPIEADEAVTLGEGNTPLVEAPRFATALGLGLGQLYIKDETRNPTGSFKDRMACVGVSVARRLGAPAIVSSSSGNAGAAAAAYAARAGLPCVVFTFREASATLVAQMRALGAMVGFAETKDARLTLVSQAVRERGWFSPSPFSNPVTGSNPLATEGYKTIAYEIAEAMGWEVPEWVVLPVCYGDALAGVRRGFAELVALGWTERVPRLVAAETSGSLTQALATAARQPPVMRPNHATIATSIGASYGTYQSLEALRATHGRAVTVDDAAILAWQGRLATLEGIWLEPAAAAALAAIAQLVEAGTIKPDDRVVALATAGGLKDPGGGEFAVPTVPADLGAALAVLQEASQQRGSA